MGEMADLDVDNMLLLDMDRQPLVPETPQEDLRDLLAMLLHIIGHQRSDEELAREFDPVGLDVIQRCRKSANPVAMAFYAKLQKGQP